MRRITRRSALVAAVLSLTAACSAGPAEKQAEPAAQASIVQAEPQNATGAQVCDVMLGESVSECVDRHTAALRQAVEAALRSGASDPVGIPNPMQLTVGPMMPETTRSASRESYDISINVNGDDEEVVDWFTTARQYPSDGYTCPRAEYIEIFPNGFQDSLHRTAGRNCMSGHVLWVHDYPDTRGDAVAYFGDGSLLCNSWDAIHFDVFAGKPCIEIKA